MAFNTINTTQTYYPDGLFFLHGTTVAGGGANEGIRINLGLPRQTNGYIVFTKFSLETIGGAAAGVACSLMVNMQGAANVIDYHITPRVSIAIGAAAEPYFFDLGSDGGQYPIFGYSPLPVIGNIPLAQDYITVSPNALFPIAAGDVLSARVGGYLYPLQHTETMSPPPAIQPVRVIEPRFRDFLTKR